MTKWYRVDLTDDERAGLTALSRRGKAPACQIRRADTLLLADEGRSDSAIAAALHIGRATVGRTRKRLLEDGWEGTLTDRPRTVRQED